MRASGIWLGSTLMYTAAQMELQSLFRCQYRLEELGHPAWPGSLGNSQESSRPESLQKADACLAALGEESHMPPRWPWLGILLVTQCCGMARVAPVSRESLQQKPSGDRLRRELLQQGCVGWQDLTANPPAQDQNIFSHFPPPRPPPLGLNAS